MAQSRLERIGTIYSRTKALLEGKAMKTQDLPLWFPIYEAFPPKLEPRFDRETPKIAIRAIFYKEDIIRAKFQKELKHQPIMNLSRPDLKSPFQEFQSVYKNLQKLGTKEEDLYQQAIEEYNSQKRMQPSVKTKTEGIKKEVETSTKV